MLPQQKAGQDTPQQTSSNKELVCIIDSSELHRNQLSEALASFYQVHAFSNGDAAIKEMEGTIPAAVLVDEKAEPSGESIVRTLLGSEKLRNVPLVRITRLANSKFATEANEAGHSCLVKPFRRSALINTISSYVNKSVEQDWENIEPVQKSALKKTVAVFNNISDLIDEGAPLPYGSVTESCAPLVEAVSNNCYRDVLKGVRGHDNYSYVHSLRVATILSLFGHTIGIRGDDLMTLSTGGLLHDVGKMTIPHEILNKPGRLEGEEWEAMKSHVDRTSLFLQASTDIPKGVFTIVEQHHEKLDGTGYPKGLKGSELNELARMASIVDIFSALTDRRVYKDPMPPEKALNIMTEMTGEIDQALLKLFRGMLLDAVSGMGDI